MNPGHGLGIKMADQNTHRMLTIDGGGSRGYFSLHWIKHFLILLGEDPDDRTAIRRRFPYLGGTSVGALIALAFATDKKSVNEMIEFFEEHAPYIFSLSSLFPSWRPNKTFKDVLLIAGIPFYQSSGPTENSYGAGLLKTLVQEIFGSDTLQDVKTNVIIPGYQSDTKTYVTFSNIATSGFIGQDFLISDIALAVSAAPAYLPSWTFGGHIYIDSGLYQNNAAFFSYVYAKALNPTFNRTCLLSVGTGLGELGFDPSGNPGPPSLFHASGISEDQFKTVPVYQELLSKCPSCVPINAVGNTVVDICPAEQIYEYFEIACVGSQESIAKCFQVLSDSSLEAFYYYRANAVLDVVENTEIDNTEPEYFQYLADFAESIFQSDIISITNFIGHFTA